MSLPSTFFVAAATKNVEGGFLREMTFLLAEAISTRAVHRIVDV
jgi:hypothetical protein